MEKENQYCQNIFKKVIEQAIVDAEYNPPKNYQYHPVIEETLQAKQDAINWLTTPNKDFDKICFLYGVSPNLIRTSLKKFKPHLFEGTNN